MKMTAKAKLPCLAFATFVLFACAAQQQQSADPQLATATEPPARSKAQPIAKADVDADADEPKEEPQTVEAKAAPEPEPEPEPIARPEPAFDPIEILTGGGTAFVVDYNNSGAKEAAEKACERQSAASTRADDEDDGEATREKLKACLAKERAKFSADVIRFRRDPSGQGTVAFYKRTGSSLPEIYVAKVAYQAADTHTVKVIVKGNMTGTRPICRERADFTVKVPNGYSIELEDGLYGRLPYDAKVGLVGG